MKKSTTMALKIAFILFTTYVITATSRGTNNTVIYTSWGAATNCPNAIANNEVFIVSDSGNIKDPINRTFLDYGMPISSVRIASDLSVSGTENGITRLCTYSAQLDGVSGKTLGIYSCADNGVASCVVTFTPM